MPVFSTDQCHTVCMKRGTANQKRTKLGSGIRLAFGLLVLGPILTKHLIHYVGMKETIKRLYHYLRLGIVAVAMTAVFSLIYRIGPTGGTTRKPFLPGALVAMAGKAAQLPGADHPPADRVGRVEGPPFP